LINRLDLGQSERRQFDGNIFQVMLKNNFLIILIVVYDAEKLQRQELIYVDSINLHDYI